MKVVHIAEKTIYGISTRTTNAQEMNPETAQIGNIWRKFDREIPVDYQNGERVYGVYYNYESDANGEFNVLAGYEKENNTLDKTTIHNGKYLVFEGKAKSADDNARVQAVIETWGKIWEYFKNENSEYKRSYQSDFEYYKSRSDIDICISII